MSLNYNLGYEDVLKIVKKDDYFSGYAAQRKGWNGKNMFIFRDRVNVVNPENKKEMQFFVLLMKNARGELCQWAPSLEDQLANDWMIITMP